MKEFSTFEDFIKEHSSKWSKDHTIIDDEGFEFVTLGLMSNLIAPIDVYYLFDGVRIADLGMGGILDIVKCVIGKCNPYCDRIDRCKKLGYKAIILISKVNGKEAEDPICRDCEYKGLILPDKKLPAYKEAFDTFNGSISTKETINWQKAYELNKNRLNCVLCGKDTKEKSVLFSTIRYCNCIEDMILSEFKEKN